jgi:hypothetical protein
MKSWSTWSASSMTRYRVTVIGSIPIKMQLSKLPA